MSRSGYSDELDNWEMIKYRGMVASALRGKRGQTFLKEMLIALDNMPTKRLIAGELIVGGEVCAIGALGRHRGLDMSKLDPNDSENVAGQFNIADCLAREIFYENDDYSTETPEGRWKRMRAWVVSKIQVMK